MRLARAAKVLSGVRDVVKAQSSIPPLWMPAVLALWVLPACSGGGCRSQGDDGDRDAQVDAAVPAVSFEEVTIDPPSGAYLVNRGGKKAMEQARSGTRCCGRG